MLSRRTDLPLERDALSRFLPWLIAFMVYLASLALAGVLVLNDMADRWDRGVSGMLTVQIAPDPKTDAGAAEREARRTQAVLGILLSTPGVVRAEAIGNSQIMALLEPWLGAVGSDQDLPLPRLIDVETASGVRLDVEALAKRLAAVTSGVGIDDHRVWLDRLIRLVRTVEILAFAVLALICLATAGTVVFTTRTGLSIHHEAIEVLHLIGAQDSYVAKQFANRALALGLRGGLIGLLLAVPTLLAIGALARQMEAGLLPDFTLSQVHWAALAGLPLAAAVIAMLTARLTVMRNLSRML